MINEKKNKFLFYLIYPNKDWHEVEFDGNYWFECSCGWKNPHVSGAIEHRRLNPNYFSRDGFWDLWEFVQKAPWRDKLDTIDIRLVNWKIFGDFIIKFFQKNEELLIEDCPQCDGNAICHRCGGIGKVPSKALLMIKALRSTDE